MKFLKSTFICLFFFLAVSSVATATPLSQTSTIHYVKSTPTGSTNCSSWENACGLQDALDIANPGNRIWVTAGTYLPTKPISEIYPKNSPTFNLKTGVAIYGGFPEDGGEWIERNWAANVTILSGELGSPDDDYDNSFHVVTGNGVDGTSILDGFTISNGRANGSVGGGGMYNDRSSPTLNNLTFTGNEGRYGGGMYNSGSSPSLTDVTFIDNYGWYGGGMLNSYSSPTLTNVSFIRNDTGNYGGGMFNNSRSSPKLTNVTFSSNHADGLGGGMANLDDSSPELTNVTFTGNSVSTSHLGGAINNFRSSHTLLRNAIIWGNTPSLNQIYVDETSSTNISYSIVEGDHPGETNIDADPLLRPLADNGGFTQTHALGAGSPAIGTANPATCPANDQRGHPRLIDGDGVASQFCDMGAYEFGYTLTVVILGEGSVIKTPDRPDYKSGELVTLNAIPDPSWEFIGWNGDAEGKVNPLSVTIKGNRTITANWQPTIFNNYLPLLVK